MMLKRWLAFCFSYVVALTDFSWSALEDNCRKVEVAFNSHNEGRAYFLSGGEYIQYDLDGGVEVKVGPITDIGLDQQLYHSTASFAMADGTLVFLKGCQYFLYTPSENNGLTFLNQGQNFSGLPCFPDAALNWREDIFVYKDCDVWKFSNTSGTFQPDGLLAERGLPCGLDAAVEWSFPEKAIFVKGSQFWKLNGNMEGPFHTDDLNICSWYLCGEASWMEERNTGRLYCNGDNRLCRLRLDQVTLPGLHNAGSGFDGGFGAFINCFVRNHARSILEQLQLGIRHLDIDTSYYICQVLGSHHDMFCGGSICRILKQVRTFLSQNPHEVLTLNFNHEMQDPERVMPALTRQLKVQLGPMLNNRFRITNRGWPKLRQAVRTNRRVFVFYGRPFINNPPYHGRFFRPNKWIHTESWMDSTWRELFINTNQNCSQIVDSSRFQCQRKRSAELLEVSIVPAIRINLLQLFGTCVDDTAEMCSHFLHQSLRACESSRFSENKSPNILLVDYPEEHAQGKNSVFHAVYHQNVRNLHRHRAGICPVKIDAAVRSPYSADQVFFFVGSKVIVYSHSQRVQVNETNIPGVRRVDAAYISDNNNIVLIKGNKTLELDGFSLVPLSNHWSDIASCEPACDAAEVWNSTLYLFQGCNLIPQDQPPQNLTQFSLPCDVDAALALGGQKFVFKGNRFWVSNSGQTVFSPGGDTLDWTIDAVVC